VTLVTTVFREKSSALTRSGYMSEARKILLFIASLFVTNVAEKWLFPHSEVRNIVRPERF
jgi:hypothetical protein